MLGLLRRYRSELFSSEGGLWIVLVHALLFVPLVMAAFFYPIQVLVGAAAGVLIAAAVYEAYLTWRRRMRT